MLTVPWPRRLLFARHHHLARGVLREAIAELRSRYADVAGGGDTVTVIQRFGSALRLNVHFHVLAIDGTFAREDDGAVRWRAAPPPTTADRDTRCTPACPSAPPAATPSSGCAATSFVLPSPAPVSPSPPTDGSR